MYSQLMNNALKITESNICEYRQRVHTRAKRERGRGERGERAFESNNDV